VLWQTNTRLGLLRAGALPARSTFVNLSSTILAASLILKSPESHRRFIARQIYRGVLKSLVLKNHIWPKPIVRLIVPIHVMPTSCTARKNSVDEDDDGVRRTGHIPTVGDGGFGHLAAHLKLHRDPHCEESYGLQIAVKWNPKSHHRAHRWKISIWTGPSLPHSYIRAIVAAYPLGDLAIFLSFETSRSGVNSVSR
jgi:hypothetical protein